MRKAVAGDQKRKILSLLKTVEESGAPFPTANELQAMVERRPRTGASGKVRRTSVRKRLVPIVGFISAGFPGNGDVPEGASIPIDPDKVKVRQTNRVFALKVRGDSMTGAGIFDGDLVIVEACEPKIGDVVAALIDGEMTLKRLVSEDGGLFLRAEQPGYPDIVPLRELTVQGVVRAVVGGDGTSVI